MTIKTANLGFPRIGKHRELKFALEAYWAGKSDRTTLLDVAAKLRADHWKLQKDSGIDIIPSNDFSLYDHVLDTAVMVGAVPAAYGWTYEKSGAQVELDTYFAMARGATGRAYTHENHADCGHNHEHEYGVPALEMTKWFDTNYHYMVPEFTRDQTFAFTANKPLDMFMEAETQGIHTRPVILGPVTFLKLGKTEGEFSPLDLLERLLPVYVRLLAELSAAGADWVQIDEPALVLDLTEAERQAYHRAYTALKTLVPNLNIMLATYFGSIGDNLSTVLSLPVDGLHIDLVRAPKQLETVLQNRPDNLVLSLGVIDGRNVWRSDLEKLLDRLEPVIAQVGPDKIQIAPSCSLLHVPIDLELETELDQDIKSWLAFATQKLAELDITGRALVSGRATVTHALAASSASAAGRRTSPKVHDPEVKARLATMSPALTSRKGGFQQRKALQEQKLDLPLFPTTTIGSFPQTSEVRKARSAFGKGEISDADYDAFLKSETETAIRWQEEIGLDVLVHGEFERNDMVQYFGEQLTGFTFTRHAWVQSYGSRYVRPPIIFGDVSRPAPMTVKWWHYAQSLTDRPVKGMLTGPVTILNWSFVRDDVARSTVCYQIGFAIRDEVSDLEKAGATMIQIDEAALREGLPLRHADWKTYLQWAVESFRLCSTGVSDDTQIHTHMCYSEFNQIIDSIAAMDADVISIETSRSKMELLEAFQTYQYPNEIGPGVYDIHSPRIPDVSEMVTLMTLARQRIGDGQLWVNPDCGLKTRKWDEVKPALVNMVEAARELRLAALA
ncbi:5-methyltetrahydropteroyltriglutamate--homocysteine S-methyltransferase [Agrobacterium sp.]|jgi:5-methyltetrahydropteroyltriglutamate--homocysteine methyltransferase|uniref:5-methyltetrahydropteroyltriglutamate-- homocysteine S-methyltransferase n=1 Tax=Agrobacterium sp. TaxID=361 RepID=UPI0028B04618